MGTILSLSIAGAVLTFLIGVLASFPVESASTTYDLTDESYSVEAVNEVGRLFSGNYMSLIDEMIAYQNDPDYNRAEARRQDMMDLGSSLTGRFQQFEQRMEAQLEELNTELADLESALTGTETQ